VKVEGEREFVAPRQTVWEVLNDPAQMAKIMPGVESFDVQDDRHWSASVKIPLGLGGLRMTIAFEKTEEREPDFARLHAQGKGVGAILNMDTAFTLSEAGGGTHMKWEADVKVAGPVGSMGQRVLQPIVNQQVGNVLSALERQIQDAAGGGDAGEEQAGPAPAAGEPLAAGAAHEGTGESSDTSGSAETPEPTTEREPPRTDPVPKDAGPPAEGVADPEGSSGAEEGLNPWAPESYGPEPEGPTTSTER
jgi:carbon monoxide dehydrogenase subunit G